jgi:hypothetical protein
MSNHSPVWNEVARANPEQSQRFLAEALAQLLADSLRCALADASFSAPASADLLQRYRDLARTIADRDGRDLPGKSVTCASLGRRCVVWLKLLLSTPPDTTAPRPLRDFVDALGLFAALFDADPAARARRARLTWLLTHDRRLDASSREAANALIEACEHLGILLWPDAETA